MRDAVGSTLVVLVSICATGVFLALSGNPPMAAVLAQSLQLLLVVSSNAKRRMLGEPLHFSDLALLGAVFRHPQFYFTALAGWQKAAGLVVLIVLIAALVHFFDRDPFMHVAGVTIAGIALAFLAFFLRMPTVRKRASHPQAEADVARMGLIPTLLLYWLRWRDTEDPPVATPMPPRKRTDEEESPLIVVVQCESFADPVELFSDTSLALPMLAKARNQAMQSGNLLVSGFGAYTMRTEYGVLFGREEDALGFRKFDPFLTAMGEVSHALPRRLGLAQWRSLFVHPHDMRFYSRDRILPAAGFTELVGLESFAGQAQPGRYVKDAAVAEKILDLSRAASEPTLIYAVTMENHGPWSAEGAKGTEAALNHYNRLVHAGDSMLGQLCAGLSDLQRPALLVFFGDHRPSIPGLSVPGGDRHTPYVIVKFDAVGRVVQGNNCRRDITPAQLHSAILNSGTS